MARRTRFVQVVVSLLSALALSCGGEGKQTSATGSTSGAGTGSSTGSTTGGASTGSGGGASGGASTGTSGGSSSGSASGTTCSFAECSTSGMGSTVECDVWNDDCPEGQKCMPWANDGSTSWNATKCTPIDPSPRKPGEACTVVGSATSGVDDCEEGSMCWYVDGETLEGICVGFCDGSFESSTCAEPNTQCVISQSGVVNLCLPSCNPLVQDCPKETECQPHSLGGFLCYVDASLDGGAFGDPCEYLNACDPGLACLNPEYVPGCQAGGCCSPYCELDAEHTTIPAPTPKCPDPAMACLAWFEVGEAPPGQRKVGVCGVAP